MKRLIPFVALVVASFTSDASAQPLMNYTYADVAYQWTHVDESGFDDANGLDARVSYSPIHHFALEGGYNLASGKVLGNGYREHLFSYGGAGWYSFCEGLDLVGRVGGIHARGEIDNFDDVSDNGVYAGASLRYLVTKEFEADLNVLYDRIEDGEWSYSLTGLYAVHENVALKTEAGMNDDSDVSLLGGVRLAM